MDIVEISAADTHDLRRRVLRDGTASDIVGFEGDDDPETFHLGARDRGGVVVAISTWLRRPSPARPDLSAHQLRGMAIGPALQGTGIGSRLLAAGIDRCASAGSALVWARARTSALEFYVRHGFELDGDEYVDPTTGLPHIDVFRATQPD